MINSLRKLINFQSYSSKEKLILEYIKTQLEDAGIKPFFQGDNLIVKLDGEDQKRAFIFNSHVDIVDIGDIIRWKHNPWEGEIVNGRIFGRGASDAKGGVLAMMETAKSLIKKQLSTDVWFTFVVKEETDGAGTKQFTEWFEKKGYLKQYSELAAVFAEPTDLNTVKYGHRGHFFIKAEKTGTSTHSSRPSAIKSHAIAEMNNFINDLQTENLSWQKKFKDSEFVPPAITSTSIEAKSDSPNKTAGYCRATFDLRTIPGYHEKAFDRIKQLAQKRGIKLSLLHPPGPAGYTNPDSKIVKVFQSVVPGIKIAINDASNDLGFFTNLGIDGVIFGPGETSQAHTTDESADIKQISTASGIFEQVYFAWAKD
ncbi:MAG: M20/M25/M40 family metallo-hydrolase [Candidatus Daviesbacteria bacterium]|nr:M20/M25/M40 family metallo-hydrolase [Candidatus Daviesbacteria bacterium]